MTTDPGERAPHRYICDLLIADAHADTLWAVTRENRSWIRRSTDGHADVPRLIEGQVALQVLALFSDPDHKVPGFYHKALEMLDLFNDGLRQLSQSDTSIQTPKHPPVRLVLTRDDLPVRLDQLSIVLSVEGGEALEGSLQRVHTFFRLGVRAMGLVWNHENELGHGVSSPHPHGLTAFGKQVVRAMESLGMLIDVSHLNDQGFDDVTQIARRPFYASHSNARRLCNHPRNLTDEQIKIIAQREGVVGINFYSPFLTEVGRADIDDVVAHIDHICSLVGSRYVCLGTDYDGISVAPRGLEDVTHLPHLAHRLFDSGFSEHDIKLIMGENLTRLFRQILPPS